MINEEELNKENLAVRIQEATKAVKDETERLNNFLKGQKEYIESDYGKKLLISLAKDLQELVLKSRKLNNNELTLKTDRIWKTQIYPLLLQYDEAVEKYNKKVGFVKIRKISDRTGIQINPSLITYFNY